MDGAVWVCAVAASGGDVYDAGNGCIRCRDYCRILGTQGCVPGFGADAMTTARQTRRTRKKEEWQASFLAELARCGNVSASAVFAGVSRVFVYEVRAKDAEFAQAWDDALDQSADVMEQEAWRRAVEGVDKPVFGSLGFRMGSGEVGKVREYSDTLLIFLLKGARPAKYREASRNINITLTPEQAEKLTDAEIDAELKRRGIL